MPAARRATAAARAGPVTSGWLLVAARRVRVSVPRGVSSQSRCQCSAYESVNRVSAVGEAAPGPTAEDSPRLNFTVMAGGGHVVTQANTCQ